MAGIQGRVPSGASHRPEFDDNKTNTRRLKAQENVRRCRNSRVFCPDVFPGCVICRKQAGTHEVAHHRAWGRDEWLLGELWILWLYTWNSLAYLGIVDCRRCRLICSLVITVVLEVREPNAGPHLGGDVLVALKQCPRKSPQNLWQFVHIFRELMMFMSQTIKGIFFRLAREQMPRKLTSAASTFCRTSLEGLGNALICPLRSYVVLPKCFRDCVWRSTILRIWAWPNVAGFCSFWLRHF